MKKIETIKMLDLALEATDWDAVHKLRLFGEGQVWLYWDGEKTHLQIENGVSPGRENVVFGILACDLEIGSHYSEGWAEKTENGQYLSIEDGMVLSEEEMALEAIQNGDWTDAYDSWAEEIRRDWMEEDRHSSYLIGLED